MIQTLKYLSDQLKELNAYSLSESEDRYIIDRRKKCLREALDALNHKGPQASIISSHLHVIMENSSIVNSQALE